MQGLSSIMEIFIGLAFIYLLLSLIVTASVEYLEIWLRKRGRLLYFGLQELLQNKDKIDLITSIYNNPLIYALYKGELNLGGKITRGNLPSYIPPNIFVLALLDELGQGRQKQPGSAEEIIKLINQSFLLPDKLKSSLSIILSQVTNNDYNLAIKKLESWYEDSTDRVSGWYKKHTQWISLGLSLLMVVVLNVDTLHITQALMVNSALRTAIVQSAEKQLNNTNSANDDSETDPSLKFKEIKTQLSTLGLPISWNQVNFNELDISKIGSKIVGLLLTSIAISFGAPFWFDVLNKFMSFRSAIKPPTTQKTNSTIMN